MFTHATISMPKSSNNSITTNTPHTPLASNGIHNVTSANRLARERTQCKLKEVVSDQLRLPKHDIQLISDFYSALTWEERMKALVKIMDNDAFIERQADLFYRYIDGRDWLQIDLDRLMVGFYTSFRKAEELYIRASKRDFPKRWNVERGGCNKHYKHQIRVIAPSGFLFRLELCSSKSAPAFRHVKIDFTPSYFTENELKVFFNWLRIQMAEEYEQAVEQSLVSQMEVGLQLHHIFSPLLAVITDGLRIDYNWKLHQQEQKFVQGTYFKEELEDGSCLTTKNYCPVAKFINRLTKDRPYTRDQAREMLGRICHATRLESVYTFKRKDNAVEHSILELENVPFSLPFIQLIIPENFRSLTTVDRTILASSKCLAGLTGTFSLPERKLQLTHNQQIQRLVRNLA